MIFLKDMSAMYSLLVLTALNHRLLQLACNLIVPGVHIECKDTRSLGVQPFLIQSYYGSRLAVMSHAMLRSAPKRHKPYINTEHAGFRELHSRLCVKNMSPTYSHEDFCFLGSREP
jgi:hypothetical protein